MPYTDEELRQFAGISAEEWSAVGFEDVPALCRELLELRAKVRQPDLLTRLIEGSSDPENARRIAAEEAALMDEELARAMLAKLNGESGPLVPIPTLRAVLDDDSWVWGCEPKHRRSLMRDMARDLLAAFEEHAKG